MKQSHKYIILLLVGGVGLLSSFFKNPYHTVAYIEIGLGFILITFVYFKTANRQDKNGVFSQWTNPKVFVKMELDDKEMLLFCLGILMIIFPLISFCISAFFYQ